MNAPQHPMTSASAKPRVGLFVTCLVDLFRPSVGFASLKLLEDAGCAVEVPEAQTCCGQPAYNSGDRDDAKAVARGVIAAFEPCDYIVAPSGSCTGMIKKHYPELFAGDREWGPRAQALAAKTFELVSFLTDVLGVTSVAASHQGSVTYHDSCSGLRELGIQRQPRQLLKSVAGLDLKELPDADVCCGFGGTFCVKYPDISNAIVEEKTAQIAGTGAETLLAGDLGCLLNMAGKLKRQGHATKSRHVAEVLAGMTDGPAIGEGAAMNIVGALALLAAVLIGGGLAGAATQPASGDAAALYDKCFTRTYDAHYLAAHPGQRVAAISANFQRFDGDLLTSVIYRLRYGTAFGFSGACYVKVEGGYLCEACVNDNCKTSGGQFEIRWSGGDTLKLVNDLTGMLAKNASGGRDYLSAGGADGEFVLRRASSEACNG